MFKVLPAYLGVLLVGLFIMSSSNSTEPVELNGNKKIVVVYSNGGQAHQSMLSALNKALTSHFTITPLNPFDSLWTTDDIGRQTVDTLINDIAPIFHLPPLNGKPVYDFLKNQDAASSLPLLFEIAKWLGKEPKNTFKLLALYQNVISEHLSELSQAINQASQKGGEDFYNFLLRNNQLQLANVMFKKSAQEISANHGLLEDRLKDYLEKEKPDLVISTMPLFNSVLYTATESLKIPFLLIAPDFDISEHYFLGFKPTTHKLFAYTLPFADKIIEEAILKVGIPKENLKAYGFPLRPDFFEPKDKTAIKQTLDIPQDKPVVMLLMGGSGSLKTEAYLDQLLGCTYPIHIIACSGNNEELAQRIEEYKEIAPEEITITHITFTQKISDFMAIADVLITKPGPTTLVEAFQMKLPVIVDATPPLLDWEKSHVPFVERHQLGKAITNTHELDSALDEILHNKKYRARIIKSIENLHKNNGFFQKIKEIIAELIHEARITQTEVEITNLDHAKNLALSAFIGMAGLNYALRRPRMP